MTRYNIKTPCGLTEAQYIQTLAGRIRYYRKQRGLTQRQIAEQLGLTVNAVSHYELGKCRPKQATLRRLARILQVSVEDLLGGNNIQMADEYPLNNIIVMCGPALPPISDQARQTLAVFLCEEGRLQQGQIEVKGLQPYREFSADDLRKLREWLGMNQQDFGLLLGVSRETVAEWEAGCWQPQVPVCRLLYLLYREPELFLQTCLHLRYYKSLQG